MLSLVVPVYFEEECIQKFIDETTEVLNQNNFVYEIIFIDDGSRDNTCTIIKNNIVQNQNIRLIEFSYNQGKQAAVTAGIDNAKGDLILYMDPDLQDPPEAIPSFVNKINQGYDLVLGIRKEKKDSWLNVLTSRLFWSILEKLTGLNIPKGLAVMRIFNQNFADQFRSYREQNRFIEGIFMRIQMNYTTIEIEERERFAGVSKFNFKSKMKLAFNAIFDFSEIPLKLAFHLGMWLIAIGFFALLCILFLKIFLIDFQAGWPSVVSLIVTGFGLQLFFMGIIAKYIGNIYKEVKNRPLYSVKEFYNFEN